MIQEIKSWLTAILVHIEENPFEDPGKQLVAAFFILLCLAKVYKLYQQLPNKFIVSLMRMLTFNCTMVTQSTCPDYDLLMSSLQKKSLKRYKNSFLWCESHIMQLLFSLMHDCCSVHSSIELLKHLYKRMAEMKYAESLLEWMSALPLYHFLSDWSCKPFGELPIEAAMTLVKNHHLQLGLNEMTVKAKNKKRFIFN